MVTASENKTSEKEKKEFTPGELFLESVFKFITGKFTPVSTPKESTCQMSTLEIFDQLQEIYPGEDYNASQVYHLMIKAGFIYGSVADQLEMKWLMRAV